MHSLVQAAVVLGCVVAGLRLRPAHALLLLTGVVVLLPAAVHLPNGLTALPTATRLTAVAVGLGLLRRHGPGLLRSTPLHLAAGAYAGVTLVTGVLLAGPELSLGGAVSSWLDLVDPLLVGVVALGCARAAGPRATLFALGVVTVLAVGAGLLEHITGHSLASYIVTTGGLESRAGQTRVRVGSDFALAFGWTVAALTPAMLGLLRRRPSLALIALAGCLAVAYWTFSRSAPFGFALGLGVLVVGLRDRRITVLVLVAGVALGITAASVPKVRARFSAAVDQGALNVRSERAPIVLDAASHHPVTGLGLTGVTHLGVGETDDSFLLTYADTGVLGVVALLVVFGFGLVLVGRGLRGPPSVGRTTAAAAFAGVVVLIAAGGAFDAFAIRGSSALLGLLLGVGMAAAENVSGPPQRALPLRDAPRLRLALVAVAVVGGSAVSALWPAHVAMTWTFATLSPSDLTPSFDPVDKGRRLIATVCSVVTTDPPPGVSVDCADSNTAAGVGSLRLEATHPEQLDAALHTLVGRVRARTLVHDLVATALPPRRSGVPTAVATAPWSAGLAALLLAFLVPTEPLRRLDARTRRWAWSVDRRDLLAGPGGLLGPPGRVGEQLAQGDAEAPEVTDLQRIGGDPLRP
jgi:hypothetical protein